MATDLEILVGQLPYLPLRQRRPCMYTKPVYVRRCVKKHSKQRTCTRVLPRKKLY